VTSLLELQSKAEQGLAGDANLVCDLRGEKLREVPLRCCGGRIRNIGVFACPEHGECTTFARGVRTEDNLRLLKSCVTCRDFIGSAVDVETENDVAGDGDDTEDNIAPDVAVPSAPARAPTVPPSPATPTPNNQELQLANARGQSAAPLKDIYAGRSCFLLCGGPSLRDTDFSLLDQPGILVAAVNNAATLFRPHLWFCVDNVAHFHESILRDPAIVKFTKQNRSNDRFRTWSQHEWKTVETRISQLPNFWFFEHVAGFDATTFLTQPYPTWGTTKKTDPEKRGTRSCMLPAIRILYWLGVRTIYLLGCDFHITPEQSYAFDDPKNVRACGSNNNSYARLNRWFAELVPHFHEHNLQVFNCTPDGNLTAFPRLSIGQAVAEARKDYPREIITRGLYRGFNEKKRRDKKTQEVKARKHPRCH
jgi:hypothetical protein